MDIILVMMTSKKRPRSTSDFALPKAKRQTLRKPGLEEDLNTSILSTNAGIKNVHVELRYNNTLCANDINHLALSHPKITHLDLTGCYSLSHHVFPLITHYWGKTLLSLNLEWCYNLTEHLHLAPPTTTHLMLRTLNLAHSKITDPGIRFFATRSPDLTNINLSGCVSITDLSLSVVAQFCKNVTTLNMSACTSITNYGLQLIAQEMKTNLRELNINECGQISGKLLNYLAFYCPNLSRLMIRETSISGEEIVNLCNVLQFTELNLHGLSLSDDHLCAIASAQISLEILDISFCPDLSISGITD